MSYSTRASLLVLLLLAACGGAEGRQWIHLARTPDDAAPPVERFRVGEADGREVSFVRDERGGWLETELPRDAWTGKEDGTWTARIPLSGRGFPESGDAVELFSDTRRFAQNSPNAVAAGQFPTNSFLFRTERGERGRLRRAFLILRLRPNQEPPASTTLRLHASMTDRQDPGRVNGQRLSGDGLVVWPGRAVERVVDVPRGSVLRFASSIEPAVVGQTEPTRFLVRMDGEEIYRHVERSVKSTRVATHEVELPAREGARIAFEVQGGFAYTSFLVPVVGPAEIGSYGQRPWGKTRPDVVVFLADTFRADNMQAYGSELPLTPFLDELAGRSLLFREAWSVATYTMPAHAALFSGLYARQTGATTTLTALPEDVRTIAECFAERGYRTGAITDSVVVSQENNLDQGFEWFDELHGNLDVTRQRLETFLDSDDGRPVFLFVQSYRAHTPYVVSEETRARLEPLLDVAKTFNVLSRELQGLADELGLPGDLSDLRKATKAFQQKIYVEQAASKEQVVRYERTVDGLLAMYRAGAADVDQGVREIHADLVDHGLLDDGWFVFTSDHGEAFNEHDKVFHGGKVWAETTRIPLFFTGPAVEPGLVDLPVSLVDLAPTLAAMGGLETDGFLGTSLLSLERERPIFSFQNQDHDASTFAVIRDGRKVMGYEKPSRRDELELFAVFDLAEDPTEAVDLIEAPPSWAHELLEELTPFVRDLSVPQYGAEAAPVAPERLEKLNELGYGGGS